MIVAQYNSTNYVLQNIPSLKFSSRETKFTKIKIDFTGKSASDLPIKYQEIKILETDTSKVLYYGYVSKPKLPMFDGKKERVWLEIELLSPQTYLTKRTIDITIKKVNIKDAVEDILASIVTYDGFVIAENNLPTTEYLSDVFLHQNIEVILSNLGGRFNFIWYVDEMKNIFIRYMPKIASEEVVLTIDGSNKQYLETLQPSYEVSDYANKLNFSNVNLISTRALVPKGTVLTNGGLYTFAYPFTVSDYVVYRMDEVNELIPDIAYAFMLSTTSYNKYKIEVNTSSKTITYDSAIGFLGEDDDDTSKVLLLQRNEQNPNIIMGFKWVASSQTVDSGMGCISGTCIQSATMVYVDSDEVKNNAAAMNTSGIVEKEINVSGKYYTYDELTAYAKSLFKQNNKQADEASISFRGDINDSGFTDLCDKLKLTKKVYVDMPDAFVDGLEFVITDISYSIDMNIGNLKINTKRANLTENYVDIFRKTIKQELEVENKYIVYYNQDEGIAMGPQIIVNGEDVNV